VSVNGAPWLIGTDTGGTFTDTVVVAADGTSFIGKALTTHGALMEGVMESIGRAAAAIGIARAELLAGATLVSHGTTVGLNALLTGRGAAVGLLTTWGFESTLPIARSNKLRGLGEEEITDALRWRKPDLIVPRRRIAGIRERIDAAGEVVVALDEAQARAEIRRLLADGVESLAIALLWSPVNPAHERRLAELAAEEAPGLPVTLSSAIAPRIGEYERTVTAVLNAYVAPLVSDYLGRLDAAIRSEGFAGRFVVMAMGGGVRRAQAIVAAPVHLLQSGPVGGITAARALGHRLGHADIIATDVGGTSFDVGLVVDGLLPRANRPSIHRHALAVPVIDIASIGTGGGSIAHIDPVLGALRVGPESAGSMPGPACYGRGGVHPTVTDAAVVLGHIDRLGGSIALDRAAARRAVATIAEPLGLAVEAAAEGIVEVACAQMADLVRRATIQRGHDPRRFALYGYGGAAPQYIGRYARDLGVEAVVIPRLGPAFSAWGATCSDLTMLRESDLPPRPFRLPLEGFVAALDRLEREVLAEFGEGGARPTIERRAGLRFARQIHRIDIPLSPGPLDAASIGRTEAEFRRRYERIVGRGASGSAGSVEIVAVGVEARIAAARQHAPPLADRSSPGMARHRAAWFGGEEWQVPVFLWDELDEGVAIRGPAFIESDQTTVVVHPGMRASADATGNLLMMPEADGKVVRLRAGGRG
jgi:N-methylhydantoinase A